MELLTVVLGASPQKERYSYLAFRTLADQKRPFVLVNPKYNDIEGTPVLGSLEEIGRPVGTVSVYLSSRGQTGLEAPLLALRPGRVIFNPGAENPELRDKLEASGIHCLEACTLVLLKTGQF